MDLPLISIITPSYNQGHFITQTIDSVLSQGYPNLEYWVIDGGSTDETVKILKSYGRKLQWVSEKDRGQTHAINKGLERAKGEVLAYLNSDDIYYPGTLEKVGRYFADHQDTHWLTGSYEIIDQDGKPLSKQSLVKKYKDFLLPYYSYFLIKATNSIIPQPSTFWSREAYTKIGPFTEKLRYCMDYDYWLRLGKYYHLHRISEILSGFRVHQDSKSTTGYHRQFAEELEVLKANGGNLVDVALHKLHTAAALKIYTRLK